MANRIYSFIFLSALLALAACSGSATPAPTPNVGVKSGAAIAVSAEGTVVPVQHSSLSFATGGRLVQILVHEGDTVKAGATLAQLDDTAIKSRIAQAESGLVVARAQLAQLKAGATDGERQAAQSALVSARANLDKVQAGPTKEQVAQLKANYDNAKAAVAQAQFRYDRIGGDTNPFGAGAPERLALEQATNSLIAAESAYNDALAHPTASEVKAAQSAVTQAQSAAAKLDPTAEQIALAEAQVQQAQTALDAAQVALQDTLLVAPFDGTVVDSSLRPGEVVSPGVPLLTLADLAHLQVETVDLAEVDVSKLSVGQTASLKLDALPDKTLTGRVARIAQSATENRGDKVYQVTLDLAEGAAEGLRWGMTASVEFAANK